MLKKIDKEKRVNLTNEYSVINKTCKMGHGVAYTILAAQIFPAC